MKRLLTIFLVLLILILPTLGILSRQILPDIIARFDDISSNPNPIIRHFAPAWRSAKKIIDIPYIVRGAFAKNTLPIFEITLSRNDQFNLINNLPDYPEENRLYEEFKNSIKAEFRYGDYSTNDAKIRYRGNSPNHWNALKKSWQINLPQDKPVGDLTTLRLFIGEDKGWIKVFLWDHIAKKLNVMHPKAEPVWLRVNNEDMGAYIMIEGWDERQKIFTLKNLPIAGDRLRPEGSHAWYDRSNPDAPGDSSPELVKLLTITAESSNEEFQREIATVIDIDAFLQWAAMVTLSGNFHKQSNVDNLNFLLNKDTKKIEPIFFDGDLTPLGEYVDISEHRIINRLLSYKPWREQYENILKSYVLEEKNISEDLEFYDAMTKKFILSIYRDTTKIQTSLEARRQIKTERDIYEHNFSALRTML